MIQWLMAAFFVVFALFALANVPRYWREPYWPAEPGGWWPYGRGLWLGIRRSEPVIIVGIAMWLAVIFLATPLVPPSGGSGAFVRPVGYVAAVFGVIAAVVVLTGTIALWNWPKWLVPPKLRNERGILSRR